MANALYDHGREGFANKEIGWGDDDIKAVLVDLDDYGDAITGATNASPIVITISSHGYTTGQKVAIQGVGGNTAANGVWTITVVDSNTFSLDGSTGNGAYTSGGTCVNLTLDEDLADIPEGARVATSGNLASKTYALGVMDAADITFTTVSGDICEALIIYQDTGTPETSRLIAYIDDATGLPVTPVGVDINVTWDSGANRIFKL
jgi:hypothetical protein